MKKKAGCCCGCLILLVALVAGAVYFFNQVKQPPKVGEDFSKLSPKVQQERRAESKKLQNQVREITRAAKEKKKKPFALVISEAQLNTLLQDNLRVEKSPVTKLRAGLAPDEITLQGAVDYKGFNAVVTTSGTIVVENNQIRCEVDSLQIGGLPAPSSWREKVSKPVTKLLNEQLANAPGRLSKVKIENKKADDRGNDRLKQ